MKYLSLSLLVVSVWLLAACEKQYGIGFEGGKRDGESFCACMVDEHTTSGVNRCFTRYVNQREIEYMEEDGQINDYVAGLITVDCTLRYLIDQHYLPCNYIYPYDNTCPYPY
jgi:hypothetical protein